MTLRAPPADRPRFEALYREHYAAVLRYARRRTDPATAEEVAAETFAVAWRRLDRIPAGDPLPWLYVVAAHELATRRRRSASDRDKAANAGLLLDAGGRDPAELLGERDVVLRAFGTLSAPDREVLALTAWEGLSHADGARAAGTTRAAFAMRLVRARRRLAAALDALEHPAAAISPAPRPMESQP